MKTLIIPILAACALLSGCQGDYFDSNRCVTRDTNHTFTEAVILMGSSNVTVKVVAWQDYQNSDSIQLWIDTGKQVPEVVYTHLNNVILKNPSPRYLPKFNKVF